MRISNGIFVSLDRISKAMILSAIIISHSLRKQLFRKAFRIFLAGLMAITMLEIAAQHGEVKAASILYVATTGSDTSSCRSNSAPCKTIQYAIHQAASGDTILVAGGVYAYAPSVDTCSFLTTRAVACLVDKNLTILGSYDNQNWSTPDITNHPAIIDGGGTYRGVAIIAYASTASLHMEGFIIQNGLAQGGQSTNTFINSAFGGGMWAQNSSVALSNLVFKNNRSIGANLSSGAGGSGSGGGLAIQSTKDRAVSTLDNVTFDGNEAAGGSGANRGGIAIGGALFTYDSALVGTNLILTNNKALAGSSPGSGTDGGFKADALGGAAGFQINSDITLTGLTAINNQAVGGGAGTTGTGGGGFGGALSAEQSTFRLTTTLIQGNQALGGVAQIGGFAMGGGLMSDASTTSIDRTQILANTAKSGGSSTSYQAGSANGGGGFFVYWAANGSKTTAITNSIFADNKIEVGTPGSGVGGGGGGASFQGVQATVTHSTFARNTFAGGLKVGQAIAVLGNGDGTAPVLGNLTLLYSIISDHTEPVGTNWSSALTVLKNNTATLSYVLFSDNTRDTNIDDLPMPHGTINISNPLSSTSVGYVSPGYPDYDYHLTSSSSAIDKAIGSTTPIDIKAATRPFGPASDVGADEYQVPTLVTTPQSLIMYTDLNTTLTATINVTVNFGPNVSWTGTSNADWLLLGLTCSSKIASGTTDDSLVLCFQTGSLQLGTHETNVQFTSPSADPVSMPVRLVKVQTLHRILLPQLSK